MRKLFLPVTFICFLHISVPVFGSDISTFFTPYGFRTPLLKSGQGSFNLNSHFGRSESESDHVRDGSVTYTSEYVSKSYSFSLEGVYALTDKLIFESSVVFYPGQYRTTSRYTSVDPSSGDKNESEYKQYLKFEVSPRLDISFRPKTNMELYGAFYFGKTESYSEQNGQRTNGSESEYFHFDFGFTILGNL